MASAYFDGGVGGQQITAELMPAGDLVFATTNVFIDGNVEVFEEFGAVALDEPRRVFGEMFA